MVVSPQLAKRPVPKSALSSEAEAALDLYRSGDAGGAEALCRQIIRDDPKDVAALMMLGELVLERGRLEEAETLTLRAVALAPTLPMAHFARGRLCHTLGRAEEARDAYLRATQLMPDFALAHCNLGMVLSELGNQKAALASLKRAMDLDGSIPETHLNVSKIMIQLDSPAVAVAAAERAVALRPQMADAHNTLGQALQIAGNFEQAVRHHRKAIELKPDLAMAHYCMGPALHKLGDIEGAIETFRRSLALDPGICVAWTGLGTVLMSLGRFDEAADCLRKALAIDPEYGLALRNLAACQEKEVSAEEEARMVSVLDNPDSKRDDRIGAGFGLGKMLDDSGRYDEAFARFAQANALSREDEAEQGRAFDRVALSRDIDRQIEIFDRQFFADRQGWGDPSELPVFIVGLFRSGTTLVEQIAASHSHVFGAGELADMRIGMANLAPSPERALGWQRDAMAQHAARQLTKLQSKDASAARITDKMPDNVFSLGLIATLFPNARIIFCHREMRDTALSCYFQRFSATQSFASDLGDCATRWYETERLMAHWRRTLPLRMLDIQYEALVGDLEGQSRRLIDFLGLEWEPACLNFHETERSVVTASIWQVRQPIYTGSIGRWRNYAKHLGPLLEIEAAHAG